MSGFLKVQHAHSVEMMYYLIGLKLIPAKQSWRKIGVCMAKVNLLIAEESLYDFIYTSK